MLLREFPRVKRAALNGERVVIETRQGNLLLIAEPVSGKTLLGCMRGRAGDYGLQARTRTSGEWKAGL